MLFSPLFVLVFLYPSAGIPCMAGYSVHHDVYELPIQEHPVVKGALKLHTDRFTDSSHSNIDFRGAGPYTVHVEFEKRMI